MEVSASPAQKEVNDQSNIGEVILEKPNHGQSIREMIDTLTVATDELRVQRDLAWKKFNQLQVQHAKLQRDWNRLDYECERLYALLDMQTPKNPTKEQIDAIKQSGAYEALTRTTEERLSLEKQVKEGRYFERWVEAESRAAEASLEIETINEFITELKGMLP